MHVNSIALRNFRNYTLQKVEFPSVISYFHGDNAQGKTNLVEALYFILQGESYRSRHIKELVNYSAQDFAVQVEFDANGRTNKLRFEYVKGKKNINLNGVDFEKGQTLKGMFNIVVVCPEDVDIIKEGPSFRRDFMDRIITKVDPEYYPLLKKYYKVLKIRNKMLGENATGREFALWNKRFVHTADLIEKKRIATIEKMSPLMRLMHRKISHNNEELQVEYQYKNTSGQSLCAPEMEKLVSRKERFYRKTLFGPHLAELDFKINAKSLKTNGSEGQKRTAVFSLKISQANLVKYFTGKTPIFIFDDVFLELDDKRKKILFSLMDRRWQIFITATRKEHEFDKGLVSDFYVQQGKIYKQ